MKWYVVHTYSGQENSIKRHLEMAIEREGLQEMFGQILVPQQEVTQVSRGRKVTRTKKFFPSYILIEMELDKTTQYLVTGIPGVTNFVGNGNQPQPVPKREIDRILGVAGDGAESAQGVVEIPYVVGDSVRITDGPFKDFVGTVDDINTEKGKLKVMVSVFGRSTPVELGFKQVEQV